MGDMRGLEAFSAECTHRPTPQTTDLAPWRVSLAARAESRVTPKPRHKGLSRQRGCTLTLRSSALERARSNSPDLPWALTELGLAHEDGVQTAQDFQTGNYHTISL